MIGRQSKLTSTVLALAFTLPTTSYADVETDTWIEIDVVSDSSAPAAEALAQELGKKLKAEKSKTIFLNVNKCEPGLAEASSWCSSFQSSLESFLVKQGLRFLPESAMTEIREKIAQEQVYQHNSMQVDVAKAVELGKQRAFQAFASVSVAGDGQGNIKLAASSVNIQEGVVTVSENVSLKIRQEQVRPWGVWFKGWMLMGSGLAGTAYGLYQADQSKQKSDDYYAEYKKADTADTATASRKKVEKQDKTTQLSNIGAGISATVALYGLFYYLKNKEDALSYRVNLVDDAKGGSSSGFASLSISPLVSNSMLGLGVETNW